MVIKNANPAEDVYVFAKKLLWNVGRVFCFFLSVLPLASWGQVYLGASGGATMLTNDAEEDSQDSKAIVGAKDDTWVKFRVGNVLSESLGFELAYVDAGTYLRDETAVVSDGDILDADIAGIEASIIARWAIRPKFSLYGRLGVFAWESNQQVYDELVMDTIVTKARGQDISAGLGMDVTLLSHVGLVVDANYYLTDVIDFSAFGAGIYFRF